MEVKFVLDFDGVLFNSAFEAFTVCNRAIADRSGYRDDVSFEEFLEFRAVVTDAWQYNRLYDRDRVIRDPAKLPAELPGPEDWNFSRDFFAARAELMGDPEWPKVMSPYDFFFLLRPLLLEHPDRFAVLSTRNVESIRQTLQFYDADVLPIFGQEDIRTLGSKIKVAEAQGWLKKGEYFIVYVDDMNAHLEPFDGKVHLPLHASWGYDKEKIDSLSQHQVITIISSLLKLSGGRDAD
ncbi:hypothetical protein [Sphingomonas jatrophae]|uniref:FMN phosphatase YigB, HAD superfamily n=1 Tax=Sphingomonas jatrophae TaxID=1166337 RepID=A0A1I6JS32_9SPHN|nr:hypothetical protein [Sphingomonas jatrophae]SFR81738.1 hypothetical protein SAMN05192580_0753 [Sphingomonas jatrophae]